MQYLTNGNREIEHFAIQMSGTRLTLFHKLLAEKRKSSSIE